MIKFFILAVAFLLGTSSVVKGSDDPHNFKEKECELCHEDVHIDTSKLTVIVSSICIKCHQDISKYLSHPIDIYPKKTLPIDMPLVDGKLSCLTCHFVHSFSVHNKKFTDFLLRRPGKGSIFCSSCHGIGNNDHVLFETVHLGSYQKADSGGKIDLYSIQCIECHDSKIATSSIVPEGSGSWSHSNTQFVHPVGVSYAQAYKKKNREFRPLNLLPKEIRLFEGNIGCGTCHNIYSREKGMIAKKQIGESFCSTCHIK